MSIVATLLMLVMIGIGLLHFYWGVGGRWPGHDEQSLMRTVSGATSGRMYGFWPCAMVTGALFAAALVVFVSQGRIANWFEALIAYGGCAVLIAVFGLRGLAPYVTPVFNYARGTPFYELNRRYYAPLCLLIAAGLIIEYPSGVENALELMR